MPVISEWCPSVGLAVAGEKFTFLETVTLPQQFPLLSNA